MFSEIAVGARNAEVGPVVASASAKGDQVVNVKFTEQRCFAIATEVLLILEHPPHLFGGVAANCTGQARPAPPNPLPPLFGIGFVVLACVVSSAFFVGFVVGAYPLVVFFAPPLILFPQGFAIRPPVGSLEFADLVWVCRAVGCSLLKDVCFVGLVVLCLIGRDAGLALVNAPVFPIRGVLVKFCKLFSFAACLTALGRIGVAHKLLLMGRAPGCLTTAGASFYLSSILPYRKPTPTIHQTA